MGGKKKAVEQPLKNKKTISKEVDIPVAGDALNHFFEDAADDAQDFALNEDDFDAARYDVVAQRVDTTGNVGSLSWTRKDHIAQEAPHKIYFDFDRSGLKLEQKASLDQNIELFKRKIAEAGDHTATIVASGHACHSAGGESYNISISERRGKEVCDYLVAHGIPQENIKVVGRGAEMPAIIDGKKVTGDRQEQWPNRRVEFSIIYS